MLHDYDRLLVLEVGQKNVSPYEIKGKIHAYLIERIMHIVENLKKEQRKV